MSRRRFLQATLAGLSAATTPPWLGVRAEAAPHELKRLGAAQPFDYARLKGYARTLAASAYKPPPERLPPEIERLDWDHWQAIRFRDDHSLWAGAGLRYEVRFAHLGFRVKKPVRMYMVEDGQAQQLAYDPAMFDYSRAGVRANSLPPNLGFGGFRIYFHTDWVRDCVVFQGASYFRAVDGDLQYGMSHRGLAIDTGLPVAEEFPDFTEFFLERPAKESSRLTVYALLDSVSVAGAYRFVIDVDATLLMDIDAALYPRKQIERIGIAPGTSMFFVGKNQKGISEDWRPEIHDSDGLQICTGAGEWIWRPLVNPNTVRVNTFVDDGPRGFGLMQRERSFAQYEDDGVFYDKRPSVWVEPKSSWGKGAVMLVEIPTRDETMDNVVAFWNPAEKPQRGQELLFGYRLYWCRQNPVSPKLAQTRATRTGIGGIVGQKRTHFSWRFVVDFVGGDLSLLMEGAHVQPVISASRGRIEITSARPLHPIDGWRAMFDLVPDESTEPINLRLYLAMDGQPLTETWLYQYTPPPLEQRRF
ncbi:MAG TPA: glucan biosynthesis protein D [Steroidobacteraceae bacterium]|nr:glucan biosynthesis protein D [Steroidobacteraceae bacterium]